MPFAATQMNMEIITPSEVSHIDKEVVVRIYNGVLLSHKKEQNNDICSSMNGPRDCHTE